MTPPAFASFKYQHSDSPSRTPARMRFVYACLALALLVGWLVPALGAALLGVALVAWLAVSKQLLLGPRYMLCGSAIVYYANVTRLTLSRAQGSLRVVTRSGQSLVIERDRFPTGARKADKITRNKAAKFDKVADKILDKVRQAAPDAEITGV